MRARVSRPLAACDKVQRALNRHGLVGSMGRTGTAGDNASMESFIALLQKNVLN